MKPTGDVDDAARALLRAEAQALGVRWWELWGQCKAHVLVEARRRVARKLRARGYSYPAIGRAMHRTHSSVYNLVNGRRLP
jgi:hypothetical protein